jgi:hypothetical protein
MGPGTHIYRRVKDGVLPINRTDFAAMMHDIDYLSIIGKPELQTEMDIKALERAGFIGYGLVRLPKFSFGENLMVLGFNYRHWLNLNFATNNTKLTPTDVVALAIDLKNTVRKNREMVELATRYGIDLNDW